MSSNDELKFGTVDHSKGLGLNIDDPRINFHVELTRLINDHVEKKGLNIMEVSDILIDKSDEMRPSIVSLSPLERCRLVKQYILNNHNLPDGAQIGFAMWDNNDENSRFVSIRLPDQDSYFESDEWIYNTLPPKLYDIDIIFESDYDNEIIPL